MAGLVIARYDIHHQPRIHLAERPYLQIQTAGTISKPSTQALPHLTADHSTGPSGELFHFDGIFFAEVPLHVNFADAYKDPYYTEVIAPDENIFVDSSGDRIIASYEGKTMTILDHGMSVMGDKESPERKRWVEFEEEAKAKAKASLKGIKSKL